MYAGGRDKIARLSQLAAALAVGVSRAASGHAGRCHSAALLGAAGVVGGILGQLLLGQGGLCGLVSLEHLMADAASPIPVVAARCAGRRHGRGLGQIVTQSLYDPAVLDDLVFAVLVGEELAAGGAGVILAIAGLGAGGSLRRSLGQLVTQSLDVLHVLGVGVILLLKGHLSGVGGGALIGAGGRDILLAADRGGHGLGMAGRLSRAALAGAGEGRRGGLAVLAPAPHRCAIGVTQLVDGHFLGLGGEQIAAESRRVDGLAIHCAGSGGSAYTDKSDIRLHRFAIGALDSGCAALVVVTPLILSRAPGMDTGRLYIAANGALVFLIAGLAVECVLDHRVSRVAARALVVVTGSVRIDPRAREVVTQSLDHPTVLGALVLAGLVGEELAAVTAGVVLAVASLGAGGSLGLGLGQLVTQSRQRLVGHGCLGGLISLEHLFADAASVILVIAAFGAGSGNRLNLGQAMPRCLDRLGLCLTAHLAGESLHAIRGAGGGRSHLSLIPAVLPGGLHIAALGFGTGGSLFAFVGGIGVLGLVDDVMAHGAFLPMVSFVIRPLVLVVGLRNRHNLLMAAHGAGEGLLASFGAGGGRSLNAGIPRMRSLIHDGAAGELVPVVVIIGCPFDWIIAGPLVVGFLLSHAADLALLRVRGGTLYLFFDQIPDMLTGSGNDQIGQLSIVGVKILMADRALIVCLHAVLTAGGGNLRNQVTVLVAGLDDGIFLVGDLLCASGILIQLAAGRIAALVVFNVAVLGAGSSLGVHLFQVVGVRGRCHAAGDGDGSSSDAPSRKRFNFSLIAICKCVLDDFKVANSRLTVNYREGDSQEGLFYITLSRGTIIPRSRDRFSGRGGFHIFCCPFKHAGTNDIFFSNR